MMNNESIKTLIKILRLKKWKDLAELLSGCYSEIDESTQYGSYWFSTLSTFLIFVPVEKYYKLKELNEKDKKLLLDLVLDIHPPQAYSPEITSLEFRILQEQNLEEEKEITQQVKETIKVFLSYSTYDKVLAGKIKSCLESYGIEIFLAHEDITPSEEWQIRILKELSDCDIFIPIITESFKKSDWTDQECGIALVKNRFIIPLCIDEIIPPYGFLSKFQALKFDSSKIDSSCKEIIDVIKNNTNYRESLSNSIIKLFINSNSFEDAKRKSHILLEFDYINKDQINKIIEGSIGNCQIYNSFGAKNNLGKLMQKYKSIIDINLLKEWKEKTK